MADENAATQVVREPLWPKAAPEPAAPELPAPVIPVLATPEPLPVPPAVELTARPVQETIDRGPVLTTHDIPGLYGGTHRFNCLAKLKPGEPFFVLRAQDLSADFFVEAWAAAAERRGCDPAKVREAMQCAADMRGHAGRKYPD